MYIIRVFFQFKVYLKHIGETITADEFVLTPLCCTFRNRVGNGMFIGRHFLWSGIILNLIFLYYHWFFMGYSVDVYGTLVCRISTDGQSCALCNRCSW